MGGGGDGSMVGDCGLMGMGRRSPIYWVCVCVMGFGSLIWVWFLWVLVRHDRSVDGFCWLFLWWLGGGWL